MLQPQDPYSSKSQKRRLEGVDMTLPQGWSEPGGADEIPDARPEGVDMTLPQAESVPGEANRSQNRSKGEHRDEPMEEEPAAPARNVHTSRVMNQDENQHKEGAEVPIHESENEDQNILYGFEEDEAQPQERASSSRARAEDADSEGDEIGNKRRRLQVIRQTLAR